MNIRKNIEKILDKSVISAIKDIGFQCERMGASSYLVGGTVRDILLGRKNVDMDIVVEGDAAKIAHILADKHGKVVVHKRFGTATIYGGGPLKKIDIASCRREKYAKPAALPDVEFSDIKEDLRRRDFTINAMAVSLNARSFGELIDYFNGYNHLKKKVIHVLHSRSFIDDPTRIFRAVRFAERYSFRIDKYTEGLIKNAVDIGMFRKTGDQRLRDELVLILKEPQAWKAVRRMKSLDELRFIHDKINYDGDTDALFKACHKAYVWYNKNDYGNKVIHLYILYLIALARRLNIRDAMDLRRRFAFSKKEIGPLLCYIEHSEKIARFLNSSGRLSGSEIFRALCGLPDETILLLYASGQPRARKRIAEYYRSYSRAKTEITGADLKEMGIKEGPIYTKMLLEILCAKIDGKIAGLQEERSYLRKLAYERS